MRRDPVRSFVGEAVDALLDFGEIVSTTVDAVRSVLATIRGGEVSGGTEDAEDPGEDGDDGDEETPGCELWGSPAVLFRPQAPDANGAMEVLFVRRGEELVGVAYRDLRNQGAADLQPGEVLVRGFGASAPTVLLKPNGNVEIKGAQVLIDVSGFVRIEPGGFSAALWDRVYDAFRLHTHVASGTPTSVPDAASVTVMGQAGSPKLSIPGA